MADLFSADAKWIWLDKPQRDKNSYACFRRMIEVDGAGFKSARVRVTADSRYELYVNGGFVGHGPVRAWPAPWPVDEYDVGGLLRPGKNVVGILVTHFGISTFQYIHDEPGVIASIEIDGERIVTDAKWKATPHDGYHWPVPRITCQQAWEEQFDARVAPGPPQEWSAAAFDDSAWQPAKVLRAAGQPPHETFVARDIPMLTLEPVSPAKVLAAETVRPADYTFALNPREFINARDRSMNHVNCRMLLATFIHSDGAQKVEFHQPHTRPFLPWKLNGVQLKFDDKTLHKTDTGVAHATLKAGWNQLMVRLPESEHHYWANLSVWTEQPVKFSARGFADAPTPWLAVGPFEPPTTHVFDKVLVLPEQVHERATKARYDQIWKAGQLGDDDLKEEFVRPMRADMVATRDIYAISASDRVVPSTPPQVDVGALAHDGEAWAVIEPAHDGAGVRVLLEYEKELIGFQTFEIDAPAGTHVDFHNFEFIQKDGRFNLNESMNNSFRYTCRGGGRPETYKTFLRRGLKYSWLTLRDFREPVRIRNVRVLMNTYPQTGAGSFACSDEKLTKIWEVGVHSVRCCSEDTYTDCPTYEQTFWVGDARNEALVDLIANGDPRLSARCLRLTGESLQRSKITESQVPSGWQNLLPTWTFLWMRWAQEHHQLTGDEAFAKEMVGYLARNIDGMKSEINERGLFNMFAWNLFDWAPMDTPSDGIVTHINCLASLGLKQSAQLARDIGDAGRSRQWDDLARQLADAVNQHLWSDEKQGYVDCIRADGSVSPVFSQQTQVAAVISGVATGARAARARELVHETPDDFVKAGSPFFMFFLLEALVQERRFDTLIDTIRDYWGKQVDAGATTFWEMYHEGAKRLTRSHCHGWSAAPTFFLTQNVLGVQPATPGYGSVLVAPTPGGLTWARGRVPTPRGVVECAWTRTGDAFELNVDAPPGTPLRVELPVAGKVDIREGAGDVAGTTVSSRGPRLRVVVRAR